MEQPGKYYLLEVWELMGGNVFEWRHFGGRDLCPIFLLGNGLSVLDFDRRGP
jgi:hypothetical protein